MKALTLSRTLPTAIAVAATLWIPAPQLQAARQAAPQKTAKITIDNFKFSPSTLEVSVGTKVTWTNQDDVPHIVASVTKKLFVSPVLDTNDAFSFTFKAPGTYEYYCSVHPVMTGKVIVK